MRHAWDLLDRGFESCIPADRLDLAPHHPGTVWGYIEHERTPRGREVKP